MRLWCQCPKRQAHPSRLSSSSLSCGGDKAEALCLFFLSGALSFTAFFLRMSCSHLSGRIKRMILIQSFKQRVLLSLFDFCFVPYTLQDDEKEPEKRDFFNCRVTFVRIWNAVKSTNISGLKSLAYDRLLQEEKTCLVLVHKHAHKVNISLRRALVEGARMYLFYLRWAWGAETLEKPTNWFQT